MATTTQHAPGTFCWPELATTDAAGAKKFYSALFGWTIKEEPMGPGETYYMPQVHGKDAAAFHQMNEKNSAPGTPPHWGTYISVDDVDAALEKVKALGGTVLMGPFDVMEHGRMGVIQDPTGATVNLWQAKSHIGVGVLDEPGAMNWNELYTNDPARAKAFYTALLGWTTESMNMGPFEYTVFKNSVKSAGGMLQIQPEMQPMPPHWLVYFSVPDTDAAVAKTQALGGKTLMPAKDIPGTGRFAILKDPQGAAFAVLQPAAM